MRAIVYGLRAHPPMWETMIKRPARGLFIDARGINHPALIQLMGAGRATKPNLSVVGQQRRLVGVESVIVFSRFGI